MITRRRPTEDIGFQIAPMIDITWILIIFFMVTSRLVDDQFAQEVDLPLATLGDIPADVSDREVITIDAQGKYFLGSQPCDLAELTRHLKTRLEVAAPMKVYIRADHATLAKQIKQVMNACAEASAVEVIFGTFKEA